MLEKMVGNILSQLIALAAGLAFIVVIIDATIGIDVLVSVFQTSQEGLDMVKNMQSQLQGSNSNSILDIIPK